MLSSSVDPWSDYWIKRQPSLKVPGGRRKDPTGVTSEVRCREPTDPKRARGFRKRRPYVGQVHLSDLGWFAFIHVDFKCVMMNTRVVSFSLSALGRSGGALFNPTTTISRQLLSQQNVSTFCHGKSSGLPHQAMWRWRWLPSGKAVDRTHHCSSRRHAQPMARATRHQEPYPGYFVGECDIDEFRIVSHVFHCIFDVSSHLSVMTCSRNRMPLGISPRKWRAWAPRLLSDLDFMGFPSLTTCIL